MISERSFQTIMAFADEALRTERGPSRERAELMSARAELDREYWRAQNRAVAADPDLAAAQRFADAVLVAEAVRKHVRAGLLHINPAARPAVGDLWPTSTFALAQWYLTRVQLLQAAPVDVAAAQLREEALAALDTSPKEPT